MCIRDRYMGETAKEILEYKHPKVQSFEKFVMSAYEVPAIKKAIDDLKPENVLIYGLEAHACVLQTTLDLLEAGYNVHALVDGISSFDLSLIHICRCRRIERCRSRWSPYH
eukprot:TRINITY_DN6387_c0_g1_i1.p1 TRINITY_DN6387_c0_g1~~TRINITY_DN6387_c0_g1_i1.p1  ORF type:complete len:111 (+),score=31.87 TRINITY_DN6387_c0_g1_i1:73-405(+)